jgi:hypothetical protein
MIRPPHIAPNRIAPPRIAPPRIPPAVVPPVPFAPTPYLLDFLTPAWNTENGAIWQPSNIGVFVGAGHVSYDAQTPNSPQWSAGLINAEPSRRGDARFSGYIAPNSATVQCQMQVFKIDASFQNGFGIIAGGTGGGAGFIALARAAGGIFSVLGSAPIAAMPLIQGIWLKIIEVGLSALIDVYYKQGGIWVHVPALTTLDGSAAALAETKPVWLFNSSNGAPVPDAQKYNAVKFEGNRDASILP